MKNFADPIALLGTSADPPTYGHKSLLEGLIKIFPSVVTWASDNPLKSHGAPLSVRHRLLEELVTTIANPKIKLIQEISSPRTVKTLEKATSIWPNKELIFVIGSDLAEELPHWKEVQYLLSKVRVGIAPRKGWPVNQSQLNRLESLGGKIELLSLEIPATSSTEVRDQMQFKNIPKPVLQLIENYKLYGM